jgi:hypothetical protein
MEKPKITHKMVRRISFMRTRVGKRQVALPSNGGKGGAVPDHGPHHTRDGSEPGDARSGNFRQLRHGAQALARRRPNSWVQNGTMSPSWG